MENLPNIDPLLFGNWFQIVALLIIVAGIIAWRWLSTMAARQKETGEKVDQLVTSVTTNNGGSTMKDQLDRVETNLNDHIEWSIGVDNRLRVLETARRGFLRRFLRR